MELKSLIVEKTEVEVEHPLLEGFKVTVAYISKDKTRKMLDKATKTVFNNRTHKPEEEVDNELFLSFYSKAMIKGWTGLQYIYLNELLPVDLSTIEDVTQTIEYSEDNALEILKNSTDFDNWLSSVVNNVSVFNKTN